MKYKSVLAFSLYLFGILLLVSCSKPAETKEEFIQKGIIMSDTLLKNLDAQLKNAEMTVDSAVKAGYFVPPPPTTVSSPSSTTK
ncbi:MAG: hypothetical protein N2203_06155 [Bacteroidia bacterium]|nr:hypothetical protein [Bacteroidia bacterium]